MRGLSPLSPPPLGDAPGTYINIICNVKNYIINTIKVVARNATRFTISHFTMRVASVHAIFIGSAAIRTDGCRVNDHYGGARSRIKLFTALV